MKHSVGNGKLDSADDIEVIMTLATKIWVVKDIKLPFLFKTYISSL